ncbi:hypothetical protein ACFY2M_19645 [Streptomyces sp. NPDC001276]|uniref:hypothetical protein n=1 Tax=Streptomyces sp. NPDC001276 TaxID=3364555 RepID=UPI0036B92842
MLRVEYQAADLESGILSDWHEDRGYVGVRVARGTKPPEVIPSLNDTLRDFLSKAEWYQIWDGEILSVHHPQSPLSVRFELSRMEPSPIVHVREYKGQIVVPVSPTATLDQFLRILNRSMEQMLAGGQFFQVWRGEIVTMDSPGLAAA